MWYLFISDLKCPFDELWMDYLDTLYDRECKQLERFGFTKLTPVRVSYSVKNQYQGSGFTGLFNTKDHCAITLVII